jgi:hypothetical protein
MLKLLSLVQKDTAQSLNEIEEIRSSTQSDSNQRPGQAAIVDLGHALALTNHARWSDAEKLLTPFVKSRPKVTRAQLMLVRVLIHQKKFQEALVQLKVAIDSLPNDSEFHDEVVEFSATLIQFLMLARVDDSPKEIFEKADRFFSSRFGSTYETAKDSAAIAVREKLEKIQTEISENSQRIDEEQDTKSASDLEIANKARAEAGAIEQEFSKREAVRDKEASILKDEFQQLERQIVQLNMEYERLSDSERRHKKEQSRYEDTEKVKDSSGREVTRTKITNSTKWNELEGKISSINKRQSEISRQREQAIQTQQVLTAKVQSITTENANDKMQTKKKMDAQLRTATKNETQAKRELQSKESRIQAIKSTGQNNGRNFNTYLKFDLAKESQYLQATTEKFFAAR